jgi:hypothetical protein
MKTVLAVDKTILKQVVNKLANITAGKVGFFSALDGRNYHQLLN